MTDQELVHYGVKGMKWGVRRNIRKQAKTSALLYRAKDYASRQSENLQYKINKKQSKNKDTSRLEKRLARNEAYAKKVRNALSKSMKDISKRDVREAIADTAFNDMFVWGATGLVGGLIRDSAHAIKTSRYIKKNG